MGRQDQLRLNQGEGQATHHYRGYHAKNLAEGARAKEQGYKGGDGGQDSKDNGKRDLLGTDHGALQQVTPLLLHRVDILANHNGVVDEDTQHQDKAKQRNGIDGQAKYITGEDGTKKSHRHTYAHPERQAWLKEHSQHNQYHQKALAGTVKQGLKTILEHLRAVVPDRQLHPLGDTTGGSRKIGPHHPGDIHDVLAADA